MKERYGAKDPKSWLFRFGVVCGGASLTAAQPYNNVVRVTIEAMAAVLGGAQSIFTAALDEAYQIPTEQTAEIALRTQQVIAYESGIAHSVDPLGGSHYVEYLTDRMEEEILKLMADIERSGGMINAIEQGIIQRRIAQRARERKIRTDNGSRIVVGVNRFCRDGDNEWAGEVFRSDPNAARSVVERYRAVRTERDNGAVERCLSELSTAAAGEHQNLMPLLIKCCHSYATVGEIVSTLKRQWGEFQEPTGL
jgi:methylmalonyl-CoA mutase N-terminal domain/subunit